MFYLFINNRPIDLFRLTYFSNKNPNDLDDIIDYLIGNVIGDNGDSFEVNGMLFDNEKMTSCDIRKKVGDQYIKVKYSDYPLNSNDRVFFDYSFMNKYILNNLGNKYFVSQFLNFLIEINYCRSLFIEYKNQLYTNSYEEILDEIKMFVNDSFDDLFYRYKGQLGLFLNAYNYEKNNPKIISNSNEENQEEFLDADDYKFFNPGMNGNGESSFHN
jgi:hypothetical protein